ncbi:MAG: thioredoxin family protein [Rhodobacteraceae bacterium]|nr:thioredoxin family protein [Paracoccaceae bacterium]
MDRRHFLVSATALAAVAALPAHAGSGALAYQPGLVTERLAAGDTVFLDFKASWCTTCRAQGRQIEALKAENPAYADRITFIDVDWDEWKGSDIVARLNVPRRSTLIVLRGDQELGRVVANPRREDIKALMDLGLTTS